MDPDTRQRNAIDTLWLWVMACIVVALFVLLPWLAWQVAASEEVVGNPWPWVNFWLNWLAIAAVIAFGTATVVILIQLRRALLRDYSIVKRCIFPEEPTCLALSEGLLCEPCRQKVKAQVRRELP